MNGNLMLKTGKIEVPEDRYMAPPPSRKGDATYLSPGTPSEFGSDIAKQVGDAHEDNPNIDLNQTFFPNLGDADKSVDLHNNIIGRAIGENNKGAKMNENAKDVLSVYMNEGLYQAQKVKGGYKVKRVKLNPSKGKQLMNILNQLDNNGMYPSERPVPENDKIRRYEALQNSLH